MAPSSSGAATAVLVVLVLVVMLVLVCVTAALPPRKSDLTGGGRTRGRGADLLTKRRGSEAFATALGGGALTDVAAGAGEGG